MSAAVAFASLLLAGCVSLTPQQKAKVDEIRASPTAQAATNLNIGAMYRQGNIFVNVRMLDSPSQGRGTTPAAELADLKARPR
jgi:starvation-inducible outer membrane lipoprotein